MQRDQKRKLVAAGVLLVAVAAGAWLLSGGGTSDAPPALTPASPRAGEAPALWTVPPFSFPDQNNQAVSKRSLQGKIWIATFIETECQHVCPKISARMAKLQQELDDKRVVFVSFSIDPQRDTQAARTAYASRYKIDATRWHYLAPPDRDTALRIANAMKIAGAPGQRDVTMIHQDRFVLVDDQGRTRGAYPEPDAAAMSRLVSDVRALLEGLPAAKS